MYRSWPGHAGEVELAAHQAFTGSAAARQRYWARSHLGWRHIARARPNAGHVAVTRLQEQGHVTAVVTQNVDGLHTAAGTRDVVELHGGLDRVVCLGCGEITARELLDERLTAVNPGVGEGSFPLRPDGDVDLDDVGGSPRCELLAPSVGHVWGTTPRPPAHAALRCRGSPVPGGVHLLHG